MTSTDTEGNHTIAGHSAEEYLSTSPPYQPPSTFSQYNSTQQNDSLASESNIQQGIDCYDSPPCNCSSLPTIHSHRYPIQRRRYPTPPQNYQRDRTNEIEPHITDAVHLPALQSNQTPPWAADLALSFLALLQETAPGTLNSSELIKVNSNVTEDAIWSETVIHLPLELGDGYLPDDEPIEVPTGLSDIANDAEAQFLSSDEDGPPSETNLSRCWESESRISDIIQQSESLSKTEYNAIFAFTMKERVDRATNQYFEDAGFLLPLAWRRELWKELFYPMKFVVSKGVIRDPLVTEIVKSKMTAIRIIESFILRVWAELEVRTFPNLKHFVDDFPYFANVLKRKSRKQDILKKIRFDQVTFWSNDSHFTIRWEGRWEGLGHWQKEIARSSTIRRNYACAVIDVLLGIWMAPGRCLFHDGWLGLNEKVPSNTTETWRRSRWASTDAAVPRCVQKQLYFWEQLPPQVDTQHEDVSHINSEASESLLYLDACYIQYRGPFTFESTPRVSEHLLITEDRKILIYTGWKRLLMLRHLKVLVDNSMISVDEISNLQLLSRSIQSPEDRSYGKGGDVRYIAYELLHTYFLLFYRRVSENDWQGSTGEKEEGPLYDHTHTLSYRPFSDSSEAIAQNLKLPSKQTDPRLVQEVCEMFSTPYPQLPASGEFKIFRKRLENLNKTLVEWRPRSLTHAFWYQGYSQDSGAVWASIAARVGIPFSVIVFVCTIISAVTGILQAKKG